MMWLAWVGLAHAFSVEPLVVNAVQGAGEEWLEARDRWQRVVARRDRALELFEAGDWKAAEQEADLGMALIDWMMHEGGCDMADLVQTDLRKHGEWEKAARKQVMALDGAVKRGEKW